MGEKIAVAMNRALFMETFKAKVRKIFRGGKRVLVARSHSVCEIGNSIPDLKIGDIVVCNYFETIKKIDAKQKLITDRKLFEQ